MVDQELKIRLRDCAYVKLINTKPKSDSKTEIITWNRHQINGCDSCIGLIADYEKGGLVDNDLNDYLFRASGTTLYHYSFANAFGDLIELIAGDAKVLT